MAKTPLVPLPIFTCFILRHSSSSGQPPERRPRAAPPPPPARARRGRGGARARCAPPRRAAPDRRRRRSPRPGRRGRRPARQGGEDLGLAHRPVRQHMRHDRLRVGDRRAVAGVEDRLAARLQPGEARAEGGEVAVRRRDERRRPAHDVVAGEERVALGPGEAQVVGGVAGGRERGQRPARARAAPRLRRSGRSGRKAASMPSPPPIPPAAASRAMAGRRAPAGSPWARTGASTRGGEGAGAGAVVAVGVGDEDRRHPLARDRGGERGEVPRVVGAGVDDRDLALAQDVAAGAGEGHRPGVRGGDDAQARRQGLGHAHRRGVAQIEGAGAIALLPCTASAAARNPLAHGRAAPRDLPAAQPFRAGADDPTGSDRRAATRGRARLLPAPLSAGHRADDPQRRLRARLRRGGDRGRQRAPWRRRRASPSSPARSSSGCGSSPGTKVDARGRRATSSTSPAPRSPRPSQAPMRRPLGDRPLRLARRRHPHADRAPACSRPRSRATGSRSRTRTSSWC